MIDDLGGRVRVKDEGCQNPIEEKRSKTSIHSYRSALPVPFEEKVDLFNGRKPKPLNEAARVEKVVGSLASVHQKFTDLGILMDVLAKTIVTGLRMAISSYVRTMEKRQSGLVRLEEAWGLNFLKRTVLARSERSTRIALCPQPAKPCPFGQDACHHRLNGFGGCHFPMTVRASGSDQGGRENSICLRNKLAADRQMEKVTAIRYGTSRCVGLAKYR